MAKRGVPPPFARARRRARPRGKSHTMGSTPVFSRPTRSTRALAAPFNSAAHPAHNGVPIPPLSPHLRALFRPMFHRRKDFRARGPPRGSRVNFKFKNAFPADINCYYLNCNLEKPLTKLWTKGAQPLQIRLVMYHIRREN